MGVLDYVKIGLAVAIVAAISGLYVLWRSASADAVSAKSQLAQVEHTRDQLQSDLASAAEAARKAVDANQASAGVLVAEQAKNASLASSLQAAIASQGDPNVKSCLALPLPAGILRALPR